MNKINEFDADGMFGKIDLAGRKTTPCHVLMQVKNGDFKRVFPTKAGTFECAKKNVIEVELDLLLSVTELRVRAPPHPRWRRARVHGTS